MEGITEKVAEGDGKGENEIVRFTVYFRSEFMEISKPSHFWKA